MDPWGVHRYGRPYLAVDDVYVDGEAGTVVVVGGGEEYDVAAPEVDGGELVRRLKGLRDPADPAWTELAAAATASREAGAASADGALLELVATLDTLGLVASDDDGGAALAAEEHRRVAATIDDLAAWLTDAAGPWDATRLAAAAGAVAAVPAVAEGPGLPWVAMPGGRGTNFPLTTLALQRRYWRASAPLAAAAVRALLGRVGAGPDPAADAALGELAGGAESPADAVGALHAAACLLALGARHDALRLCSAPTAGDHRVSGANLALEAERAARAALEEIGPTAYVGAFEAGTVPPSFVQGAAIEEYHITRRFVEMITPVLARRFRGPLRERVFRYYTEELGHEVFERATCRSLGIAEERLDAHVPTPYHWAYVDVYTAVAQGDPVAYLASVMVTEGLPGDPFGVNDLLGDPSRYGEEFAAAYRQHEDLNEDLEHATLARVLLSEVPSVTPAQRVAVLDTVSYLVELTHRAWSLLFDLHRDGPWARSLPPLFTTQR